MLAASASAVGALSMSGPTAFTSSRAWQKEKQCVLVLIGVDEWGRKEVLGLADGCRESTQSWRELLLDLSVGALPKTRT